MQDVQCAWTLLLHSAVARANYQLRVVRPTAFAQGHDDGVWSCLCRILNVDPTAHTRQVAERNSHQAICLLGGWADSLAMIYRRHRGVATGFLTHGATIVVGCSAHGSRRVVRCVGFRTTFVACGLAWCTPSSPGRVRSWFMADRMATRGCFQSGTAVSETLR